MGDAQEELLKTLKLYTFIVFTVFQLLIDKGVITREEFMGELLKSEDPKIIELIRSLIDKLK